jgi:hypothetical protein
MEKLIGNLEGLYDLHNKIWMKNHGVGWMLKLFHHHQKAIFTSTMANLKVLINLSIFDLIVYFIKKI